MKKSIKKYNDFIKESISNVILERDKFRDTIKEDLDDEMFVGTRSYSDLCKTNNDPDEQFKEMQDFMDSKGFTIEKIKELFSEENTYELGTDIIDTYNSLDDISATVDVYFYKLFEKLGLDTNIVELGGHGWCQWENMDEDEALIRYKYGYHQTKYGQLMLKQCGKTAKDLKRDAMEDLKSELKNDFDSIISKIIRNKTNKEIMLSLAYEDYVVLDEDRMIIFCNEISKKISDNISDITSSKITSEDVSSEFVKSLKWFRLSDDDETSMEIIDGDLILHGDFGI